MASRGLPSCDTVSKLVCSFVVLKLTCFVLAAIVLGRVLRRDTPCSSALDFGLYVWSAVAVTDTVVPTFVFILVVCACRNISSFGEEMLMSLFGIGAVLTIIATICGGLALSIFVLRDCPGPLAGCTVAATLCNLASVACMVVAYLVSKRMEAKEEEGGVNLAKTGAVVATVEISMS